jgi:zinc protease
VILDRQRDAAVATPSRIGLSPFRRVLPNGAVLLAKHTRTIPAVTISIAMRSGTVCDPSDAPGACHLLSRVMDRGTAAHTAAQIAEDLDNRGITLSTGVTRHLVSLACTCLSEDFDFVFGLMGEVVTSPSFPEEETARQRTEVITLIRQDEDSPIVRATEALMGLLYPDPHPYGRPAKGRVEVLEHLTRADLTAFHAARFSPSGLIVTVVGDQPVEAVNAAADRVFGAWQSSRAAEIPLPPVEEAHRRRRVILPMMNKAQVDVAYGFTAVARADPAYYACWLMNNVLGQYSMGGRLGDSIRERQGMAYYVSSRLDANLATGPLTINAGVSSLNVDRAVASIDEEVGRLAREGVTAKELNESRQYLVGSMPRALETNAGIAGFMQTAEVFGLGLDFDVRLPDLLQRVTLDDVHAVAQRVLDPERATIVIAGPYPGPQSERDDAKSALA